MKHLGSDILVTDFNRSSASVKIPVSFFSEAALGDPDCS